MEVQTQVQRAVDELVGSGAERGLQVAVYRHGEQIVDAVAGTADPATGRGVTSATVFHSFSTAKAAASAVVHRLVERGLFTYDTPVAELWPEFGVRGKEGVTVRHVLTHSAGVPGIPPDTTAEDLCDWDKMCAAIADSELWWEPGTRVGYHAKTFGYLAGEIVRRATGQSISAVLRDEITGPLGVADELYLGMPEAEHHRLAVLEDDPAMESMEQPPPDSPMFKVVPPQLKANAAIGNRRDLLAATIPSGGELSARAIARLYAALLGEVDGARLISPERLREIATTTKSGTDAVFGNPSAWGLGFGIGFPGMPKLDSPTRFGMAGAGGSYACGDTASGVAFAVTKNRLTPDFGTIAKIGEIIVRELG